MIKYQLYSFNIKVGHVNIFSIGENNSIESKSWCDGWKIFCSFSLCLLLLCMYNIKHNASESWFKLYYLLYLLHGGMIRRNLYYYTFSTEYIWTEKQQWMPLGVAEYRLFSFWFVNVKIKLSKILKQYHNIFKEN